MGNNSIQATSPYIAARREWNERYGNYVAQASAWRWVAITALFSVILAIGGLIYVAGKSQFIPYVVEVDQLGRAAAVGPVTSADKFDNRVVKALLARLVHNWREVTADIELQKQRVFDVYAHIAVSDPVYATLNEYYQANDPFQRARTEIVSAEIISLLPLGNGIWQVEWSERKRDRKGASLGKIKKYRAAITTVFTESPQKERQLLVNPIGLYITDLTWSEIFDTRLED